MQNDFNHAANDSPRSGSSNRVTSVVWSAIVAVMVVFGIWLAVAH